MLIVEWNNKFRKQINKTKALYYPISKKQSTFQVVALIYDEGVSENLLMFFDTIRQECLSFLAGEFLFLSD